MSIIVGLSAGHQKTYPGAEYHDLVEHEVCRDIVYATTQALKDHVCCVLEPVAAYNEKNNRDDLIHKIEFFNKNLCDCVIEVHLDALPQDKEVEGFHVIHHIGSEGGLALAEFLTKSMSSNHFKRARKPHPQPLPIVRDTKAWAVLIECGFLTHAPTAKKLKSLCYREKIGYAIADGIRQFGG